MEYFRYAFREKKLPRLNPHIKLTCCTYERDDDMFSVLQKNFTLASILFMAIYVQDIDDCDCVNNNSAYNVQNV